MNEDWESVIPKKWPRITEEEWEEFKEREKDPRFIATQEWYATLRAKRKFNHCLGSLGIEGKKPMWDAELAARGIVPPAPTMLRHDRSTTFVRSTMTKEQWVGLKPIREDQKVLIIRPQPPLLFQFSF